MSKRSLSKVSVGDDVLVTHSFSIVDKFDKKRQPGLGKSEEQNSENLKQNGLKTEDWNKQKARFTEKYSEEDSFPFAGLTEAGEVFDPSHVEVCLNITGLIAGVAVFLVLQLVLVFAWTHFWQTRNKKKTGSSADTTLR